MVDRREEFVQHYLACRNGAEAARRAGYARDVAKQEAWRLLRDPEVRRQVKEAHEHLAMTAEEALSSLGEIARGEWSPYIQTPEMGLVGANRIAWIDLAQMAEDGKTHLLQSIQQTQNGVSVRFPDRLKALQLILQGLGLLSNAASEADIEAFLRKFGAKGE